MCVSVRIDFVDIFKYHSNSYYCYSLCAEHERLARVSCCVRFCSGIFCLVCLFVYFVICSICGCRMSDQLWKHILYTTVLIAGVSSLMVRLSQMDSNFSTDRRLRVPHTLSGTSDVVDIAPHSEIGAVVSSAQYAQRTRAVVGTGSVGGSSIESVGDHNPMLTHGVGDTSPLIHAFQVTMSKGDTLYAILLRAQIEDKVAFHVTKLVNKLYNLSSLKENAKIYVALADGQVRGTRSTGSPSGSNISGVNILIDGTLFKLRPSAINGAYSVVSKNGTVEQIYDFDEPHTSGKNGAVKLDRKNSTLQHNNILKTSRNVTYSGSNAITVARSASKLHMKKQMIHGVLSSTRLYDSLRSAGVNRTVLAKAVSALSSEIDVNKDLKKGGEFSILYDKSTGKLLYLAVDTKQRRSALELYRFESGGGAKFYRKDGSTAGSVLLRAPLKSVRISSSFGSRMHPTLHYVRMHKGVDFRAPHGTPIMSTGDGVVEKVAYDYHYGRFIKIRHDGQYSTLYAHMSGFAKDISRGVRVKQGQVIGFVGTTGLTSGAHVHYELIKGGRQVNPASERPRLSTLILAQNMRNFKQQRYAIESAMSGMRQRGESLFAANTVRSHKGTTTNSQSHKS